MPTQNVTISLMDDWGYPSVWEYSSGYHGDGLGPVHVNYVLPPSLPLLWSVTVL